MSDPVDIKTLGKFGEELGECASAAMRCLIQGIDEVDPETGYPNREWLEDEIADVQAGAELTIERFNLDQERIDKRKAFKKKFLKAWHAGAGG
jgi:hypothetical protein